MYDWIYLILLNSALTGIFTSLCIGIYFSFKVPIMVENLQNELKAELQEWLNSEKGQKAIYSIGALIGSGATAGTGLKKSGGKFSFEGLIGQLIGSFLQKGLPGAADQGPPAVNQESVKFKSEY